MMKRCLLFITVALVITSMAPGCAFVQGLGDNLSGKKKKSTDDKKVDWTTVNQFLKQRPPKILKEMEIYSDNFNAATDACTPNLKRDKACVTKVHTRARVAWLEGIDSLLAAGDGENAHWAGRWLIGWMLKTWYGDPAWSASFDVPLDKLNKASALEAAKLAETWAKRKTYAILNSAECVPTANPLPARGTALKPQFVFAPGDEVHVRCYYDKPLGEFSQGMKDARLEVRVNISAEKQPKGKKYTIPVAAAKLGGQNYFDYALSLGDWAKGSSWGYASTQAVFVHVTGYEKKFDKARNAIVLVPITAELFTPMSFSFAK
jgi:hypothetical protein